MDAVTVKEVSRTAGVGAVLVGAAPLDVDLTLGWAAAPSSASPSGR